MLVNLPTCNATHFVHVFDFFCQKPNLLSKHQQNQHGYVNNQPAFPQSLTRCVKCFEKRPQTLFSDAVYPDTYYSRSKDRICWTAFLLKALGAKFSLLWQGEGMKGRILYLHTCGTLGQSSKMKGYSCSEVTRWDAILIADLCWLLN